MAEKPYRVTDDNTGLGFWYRFRWRLAYIASSIYGSADRQASLDPKRELRKERAARLIAAYQEQGREPSQVLLRAAREG
ncbi:MAG: hypothetical protein QJR09_08695 [Micrococcus sp.]|nr:hypothetical protein [Micrococcus sp.]